jgi:large subunit ribosomal protein L17
MRHSQKRLQLGRFTSWNKATLRSLAANLIACQSIRTTLQRAKAVQPVAEKLISLAKQNSLAARRRAYALLGSHKLVKQLFSEVGPRFGQYAGGYTRIIALGQRRGDGAKTVILELTEIKKPEAKERKEKKAQKPEAEAPASQPGEKAQPQQPAPEKETRKPEAKKPAKKFLGGLRNIFKKERDSL